MKKLVTVLLAVVLVFSLASVAMAAQLTTNKTLEFEDGKYSYMPTTWDVYGTANDKLTGIYLPNQDNPEQYRIHSNYAKNTDACAACHATHTAVGAALLQWGNVYEACFACHDGTVSTTYNVKGGEIGDSTDRTFGGMFGPTAGETSASNHGVSGGIDISAAPGGTDTANANEVDPTKGNAAAAWNVEFGCQSCHNPHGAGANARILNANPNGQMWEKFNSGDTKDVTLVDAGVTKTQGATTYDGYKVNNTTFILKGYPYSSVTAVYDDGAPITTAIIDNTNTVYSVVYIPNTLSGTFTINYVPALKVKMNITDYLGDAEDVTHVSGLNDYCGACHTDYNTADDMAGFVDGAYDGSGSHLTGEYSEAYRHQVGMDVASFTGALTGLKMPREGDTMTCETCHFAHGTNKDLWNEVQDTNGNIADDEWVDEISGSSALKRLPNMATCEACHQKGQGNEGYGDAYAGAGPTKQDYPATTENYEYAIKLDASGNIVKDADGVELRGSRICMECHKTYYEGWKGSMHNKKLKEGAYDTKTSTWNMLDKARTYWNSSAVDIATAAGMPGNVPDTLSSGGPGAVFPTLASTGDDWLKNNVRFVVGSGLKKQAYVMQDAYAVTNHIPQNPATPAINPIDMMTPTNYAPMLWVTALNKGFGGWAWKPFSFTWETNCIGCHVTGISKLETMDFVSVMGPAKMKKSGAAMKGQPGWKDASVNVVFNEPSIGCESCHGPGAAHVKNPSKYNIVNPDTLSKTAQAEACGACHANGNGAYFASSGFPSWDFVGPKNLYDSVGNVTYSYVPGKSFTDNWIGNGGFMSGQFNDRNNWYFAILPNPSGNRSMYFYKITDGPLSQTSFNGSGVMDEIGFRSEYEQWKTAPAEMQEALSCSDCHDLHKATTKVPGVDQSFGTALRRPAAQLCSQCHANAMTVAGDEPVVDEFFATTEQILNVMAKDVQCDVRSYGPRHTFSNTVKRQAKVGGLLKTANGNPNFYTTNLQYQGGRLANLMDYMFPGVGYYELEN